MATIAERLLAAIEQGPLDDDALAVRLSVSARQTINQVARRLQAQGVVRRHVGPDGKIVNALADAPMVVQTPIDLIPETSGTPLSEDEVKAAVRDHLEAEGFTTTIAWGRTRGIDIDARHPDGRRYVIEAKAEAALKPQQVNYFLNALGELIQRMSEPTTRYALALPSNRQYRGLVQRLPTLARQRLELVLFWVSRVDAGFQVRIDDPVAD